MRRYLKKAKSGIPELDCCTYYCAGMHLCSVQSAQSNYSMDADDISFSPNNCWMEWNKLPPSDLLSSLAL